MQNTYSKIKNRKIWFLIGKLAFKNCALMGLRELMGMRALMGLRPLYIQVLFPAIQYRFGLNYYLKL